MAAKSQATFTLIRLHLDPFFLLKTELFFLPVHTTPFSDKDGYLFTLGLKNAPDYLFLKTRLAGLVVVSVFKFLRFWCSHYRYAFLFNLLHFHSAPSVFCQRIHIALCLGRINVNAKPKTELNISVFMQKRVSVNGASIDR